MSDTFQIGVRELKSHLSRHLARVRSGARLVVTDRGEPIATISPIGAALAEWADAFVQSGRAQWSGGKPAGSAHPAKARRGTVSDAVLEDRK
jgi:prevent-host-death family protein